MLDLIDVSTKLYPPQYVSMFPRMRIATGLTSRYPIYAGSPYAVSVKKLAQSFYLTWNRI